MDPNPYRTAYGTPGSGSVASRAERRPCGHWRPLPNRSVRASGALRPARCADWLEALDVVDEVAEIDQESIPRCQRRCELLTGDQSARIRVSKWLRRYPGVITSVSGMILRFNSIPPAHLSDINEVEWPGSLCDSVGALCRVTADTRTGGVRGVGYLATLGKPKDDHERGGTADSRFECRLDDVICRGVISGTAHV